MNKTVGMEAKGRVYSDFNEIVFRKFLIQFVNSKKSAFDIFLKFFDDETKRLFPESLPIDKFADDQFHGDMISFIKEYVAVNENNVEVRIKDEIEQIVKDYRTLIIDMLKVASEDSIEQHLKESRIDKQGNVYYVETDVNRTNLESRIQDSLKPLYEKIVWRGKSDIGLNLEMKSRYMNTANRCKQLLADVIMTMLRGFDIRNPFAYKYVNCCPLCKIWFVKNRKDQVFCSEAHRKQFQNDRDNAIAKEKRRIAREVKKQAKLQAKNSVLKPNS